MSFQASTYVPLHGAKEALSVLVAHAREHDAALEENAEDDWSILVGENTIRLRSDLGGLAVDVSAQSESILYFLKEAAVQHLGELNAAAAEAVRWDDPEIFKQSDHPPGFIELSVLRKSEPMQDLIRLTLAVPKDAKGLVGPGIHLKLMLPVNACRHPVWPTMASNGTTIWPQGEDALHVRYYTIKALRPEAGEVDIDLVRHQGGLIAEWAERAQVGARIGALGPAGGEGPDDAGNVLLCGDRTALPAIARLLEHLPDATSGHVVGEAVSLKELTAYLPETDLQLHALPPSDFREKVLAHATELTACQAPDFAWFAGEYNNAQAMRKFFKAGLGLSKGTQFSIAYWRDGAPLKAD